MSVLNYQVNRLMPGNGNDFVELERRVLDFWEVTNAFEALRQRNASGSRWSFLDGPITANNPMGVHHAWGRTLKDIYQRYHAMLGQHQRYQNGFDCQGLWVEVEVEKELGFRSKRDIEQFGLERFIVKCKDRASHFAELIKNQSRRLGVWMNWANSYFTFSEDNNYAIWSFLKRCHERGLLYKGNDIMPWCPRCGTGISQHEMHEGYRSTTHTAITLRFPLREHEGALLVWTTTPWTLSSNVAVAVHPELTYLKVRHGGEIYYIAQERADAVLGELATLERLESLQGADMIGWLYDGPYDDLENPRAAAAIDAHRVIGWNEIVATEGTGVVHIAPGCGKEDSELGHQFGLPSITPIDESGRFISGFGFLTGRNASEVGNDIVADLRSKGLLVRADDYEHIYPHCWRCKTELLFRKVDEWFIAMDSWRDEIMASAQAVRWIPDYGAEQEQDWLRNMSDWMISKKRYWGLALPIWECTKCGAFEVIGGRDELKQRAVEGWADFDSHTPHRPWVDSVEIDCAECGSRSRRIPDVGSPWLDAGIVPFSTMYYFTDREEWRKWFPADFITECFPGQFRTWFYAILAMSTMLEKCAPMKVLLGHALVRDANGEEMHKSRGNAIGFDEAVERAGADVLRWGYARQPIANHLNFSYDSLEVVRNRVFDTLWNVHTFYKTYSAAEDFNPLRRQPPPVPERPLLDRWILSRLQSLVVRARNALDDYEVRHLVLGAEEFLDDLSNWYVRQSRRRFWKSGDDEDKTSAYHTLWTCLETFTRIVAPVAPFMSEAIFQHVVRPALPDRDLVDSIHHRPYPEGDDALIDIDLEEQMAAVAAVVRLGLSARNAAGLKLRQPLSQVLIAPEGDKRTRVAIHRFERLILDSLNVKTVRIVDTPQSVGIRIVPKANFKTLGPRYGMKVQQIAAVIAATDFTALPSPDCPSVDLQIAGETVNLELADVAVHLETPDGLVAVRDRYRTVAIRTELTDDLRLEGLARDAVRVLQVLRKDIGLNVDDRIHVLYEADDPDLQRAMIKYGDFVAQELLALTLEPRPAQGEDIYEVKVRRANLRLNVTKASTEQETPGVADLRS